MKRSTLIAGIAALGLIAGTGAALAFGKEHGPRFMRGGMMPDFGEIDSNDDGKLTPAEIEAHARARFNAADSDGNGKLSSAEMQAAAKAREEERRAARRSEMAERMIGGMDSDGDGALSFEEMAAGRTRLERMFEFLDADNDGAVSLDEMTAARERFGARRHGPWGEGGPGHGGRDGGEGHHGAPWWR